MESCEDLDSQFQLAAHIASNKCRNGLPNCQQLDDYAEMLGKRAADQCKKQNEREREEERKRGGREVPMFLQEGNEIDYDVRETLTCNQLRQHFSVMLTQAAGCGGDDGSAYCSRILGYVRDLQEEVWDCRTTDREDIRRRKLRQAAATALAATALATKALATNK